MPKNSNTGINQTESPLSGDLNKHAKSMQDLAPTDIEGVSLARAANGTGRVVVSMQHTVKLEDGVRLELRVTDPNQAGQVHTP